MSAPSTIGSVCTKEEVKGTEYSCACQTCDLKSIVKQLVFGTPIEKTTQDLE